jgi:hypothetical protein
MRLVFPPFTPDKPSLSSGADRAENVLPAPESYRPISGLAAYSSNALAARCQGGEAFVDSTGAVHLFAGDATSLYHMTAGATTFSNVSKVGGYSCAPDSMWSFAQFGDKVYASQIGDPIQVFDMIAGGSFADLAAAAPKARAVMMCKNFLVAIGTSDGTFGSQPSGIWWSKQGDPSSWPTPGTTAAIAALSDRRVLDSAKGWLYGGRAGLTGADAVLLAENGIFRLVFDVGGNDIFQVDLMEGAVGTRAPGSIVQRGGVVEYLGADGWYATDGVQSTPTGFDAVDKFFFSDATHGIDQSNLARMSSVRDPINKCLLWAYPSVSSNAGVPDTVIVRNYGCDRWSLITGLGTLDVLFPMRSLGYSLDTLDALGNLDTLPYSLDSRQLTGGLPLIGAFKSDHMLYTFTGPALAATITTSEQSHPSGQRMGITEAWPLVEGTSVTPTVTPLTRNRQEDAPVAGSASAMNATGCCPLRVDGRFVAAQIDIPAGATWSHAYGLDIRDDAISLKGYR